ncbi:MAG: GTP-binding protein [Lachnospiraceae bacterium]|nr:GTP-binding protein [Lachnospiraceae bacterium]
MKILVVSGFLGAGKTTFIKELIRKTGQRPVVMENELGETDLDSREIAADGQTDVLEFMEGCVCCSMKESFTSSVITISATLSPEYLIVELSGVGRLGNILANLRKVCYEQIRLLPPVVIVTPRSLRENLSLYGDICSDQIGNAGVIVLSKIENEDVRVIAETVEQIRAMNPSAQILETPYTGMPEDWWNALLRDGREVQPRLVRDGEDEIDQYSLRNVFLHSEADLILFLQELLRGQFGDITRAKGVVRAGRQWLRFDVADSLYAIRGEEKEERSQCVFIGRDIRRSRIGAWFEKEEVVPRVMTYGMRELGEEWEE